jgi:shikimate kinase
MKIFLVGFMGAGKTTNGKKLAKKLNLQFIDLDYYIEQKHRATISFIFDLIGEEGFRIIEHRAILEIIQGDNFLLSTGGGSPCFYNNMDIVNKNGLSIYLKLPAQALWQRLSKAKKKRPLLNNLNNNELLNYINNELKKREHFYNKADLIVDVHSLNINDLTEKILSHPKTTKKRPQAL